MLGRCAILILMLGLAIPTAGSNDDARAETQTVVEISQGGVRSVPAGARTDAACGGTAPAETHCTTQLHVGTFVDRVSLSSDFTGTFTLESRLFHATSVHVTHVTYINGEFAGYNTYGQWPQTPFWHECFAYEVGTEGTEPRPLPGDENGVPGGAGVWTCGVTYTLTT